MASGVFMFMFFSIGSNGRVGGARNMKSMWPPLTAIFIMTFFYRAGGRGHGPLGPPGSATVLVDIRIHNYYLTLICDMTWNLVVSKKLRQTKMRDSV